MTDEFSLIPAIFPQFNHQQLELFKKYGFLLQEWNQKINLVSRKDIEHVFARHILYSLTPVLFFKFYSGNRILDVGTGGGLPGIPLAIACPEVSFHLIDRTRKKIEAVRNMILELGLKNITAEQSPVEDHKGKYSFITGRGVTGFPEFTRKVAHCLERPGKTDLRSGVFYLSGGEPEIPAHWRGKVQVFHLNPYISKPWFQTKKVLFIPTQNIFNR